MNLPENSVGWQVTQFTGRMLPQYKRPSKYYNITISPLYNYLVLWKYSIFTHLLKHMSPRNPHRDKLKHCLEFWKSMISSSSLRCWDSFHYRVCVRPGQMCDRWVIILLWRSHWSHTASLCRSHRRLITASFDQTDKLTAADQMSFLPFCLHQSPVTNHVSEDSIQFFHTLDGLQKPGF